MMHFMSIDDQQNNWLSAFFIIGQNLKFVWNEQKNKYKKL